MNKLSVLVAISAVILVLGCVSGPEPVVPTTLKTTTLKEVPTTVPKIVEEFKEAVSASDVKGCDDIGDERLKDICIKDIAVKEGDESLCTKVGTSDIRDLCYFKLALNKGDSSLCSKINRKAVRESCSEKA